MSIQVVQNTTQKLSEHLQEQGVPVRDRHMYDKFLSIGLPKPKDENYKYTKATQAISKLELSKVENFKAQPTKGDIVFLNGKLQTDLSLINIEGVHVSVIEKAVLPTEHGVFNDSFQVLNQARFSDGVLIEVKNNVKIERLFEIVYINDSSAISIPVLFG